MRNASHLSPRTKSTRTKIVVVATAAVVFLALTTASATADPPQFDSGAGLPTVGNFNPVALNGTDQLTSTTIAPFVITDSSGVNAGWNVTLLVPNFQNGSGPDCSTGATVSLGGGNLSMNPPVVTAADVGTSMTGVTTAGYSDFTTARTIIDAATGDGAGTYDVAPEILRLTVPTNTLVGSYCTQATIAITSGP